MKFHTWSREVLLHQGAALHFLTSAAIGGYIVKIQGSLTQVVREYATRKFSDKMRHVSKNVDYLTIFCTFVYLLGHPVSIVHMYA